MTPHRIVELLKKGQENAGCHGASGAVRELVGAFNTLRRTVRDSIKCTTCQQLGMCDDHRVELEMLLDHPEPDAYARVARGTR